MAIKEEEKTKLILHGMPIWKGIVALSFPVFLVNIVKTLQDLVDAVTLGHLPDVTMATQSQSAVALTWPIFFIFISFGVGLSIAGNALIGQYIGSKNKEGARKYANNVIFLSLFLGLAFNILVYFVGPLILKLMVDPGNELDYATVYLRTRSFGLPILFLSFGFQAVRRATGDTLTPVIISAASILINMVLTPTMVLVLNMGIKGAGLSTMIANNLMLPGIIYYLLKAKTGIRTTFNIKSLNPIIAGDIFKVAIPASIGQSIQAVGFVILNAKIRSYGEEVLAAFYIGNRINSLVMFPVMAISTIVAIYIAQNIGANNVPRAKKSIAQGMLMGVLFMAFGILLILPFRHFIVTLFTKDDNTIKYAVQYMLYIGMGLPLMAVFQTFLATYQGSGETKYALMLAVIRLWIFRLPFVFLIMAFTNLGPSGIWYSMLASNVLACIVGFYLYKRVKFTPKIRNDLVEV